jgi:hypothetical protein
MRARLLEYKAKFPESWKEEVFQLTWKSAMTADKEKHEFDETWEIEQGKKWAQRLHNTFGTKLSTQPRVAAIALELYSKSLVPSLIEEWREEIRVIYEEEVKAAADSDF